MPPGAENSYQEAAGSPRVRAETKEWLFLMGKTVLTIIGGILALAGTVDLAVDGPSRENLIALVIGLALAVPPMAFAFRDAVREAKQGRI